MNKQLIAMGMFFLVLFVVVSIGYSECKGDLNCDGVVDGSDLAVFAKDFGKKNCPACLPSVDSWRCLTQGGDQCPDPRYTSNGDGTVTDNFTGTVWLANTSECITGVEWVGGGSDVYTYVRTISDGKCGLTDGSKPGDWRLPTTLELLNLSLPVIPGSAMLMTVPWPWMNIFLWPPVCQAPANIWSPLAGIGKCTDNASERSIWTGDTYYNGDTCPLCSTTYHYAVVLTLSLLIHEWDGGLIDTRTQGDGAYVWTKLEDVLVYVEHDSEEDDVFVDPRPQGRELTQAWVVPVRSDN